MRDRWLLLLAAMVGLVFAMPGSVHAEEEPADATAEVTSDEAFEADDAEEGEEHSSGDHDDDSHHAGGDHGAHHGDDHGESAPDPLATDPDLAIWTLIVFVAMLAILSKIAWKPIMEGLQAREDGIVGKLASADEKHEQAKALLAEHQREMAGAADQVRALLEEARRDADATIAQAKSDAKSEFEAERLRAERDIEQARSAAVRSLAEQTAGLAIDLAGKVVRQDISDTRQKEIVHEALSRFGGDPSAN